MIEVCGNIAVVDGQQMSTRQFVEALDVSLPKYFCTKCNERILGGELALNSKGEWARREGEFERRMVELGVTKDTPPDEVFKKAYNLQIHAKDLYHVKCVPSQ
jgi:hypothetical protein